MKKVWKSILVSTIILSLISPSFAINFDKNAISSHQIWEKGWEDFLKEIKKEKEIKEKIKKFINQVKSEEKIKKILLKVEKMISTWKMKQNEYLILRILEGELREKLLEFKRLKVIKKFKKINELDKKSWEVEILKLQNILKKEINKLIDESWKSFEKYLYIQEKGDLKASLNIDMKEFWKIKTKLDLKNYLSNTQFLDNHLKTNLELLFDLQNKWDSFSLDISTNLEFIQKGWKYYLLIKNLKADWKWKTIKVPLEMLKKFAWKNKFVEFSYFKNEKEIYDILTWFSKKRLKKSIAQTLEKPLFTPYKKVWKKYYLIPTQNACDSFIKSSRILIPYLFYTSYCTKEMYDKLLIEMEDNNFEIYLENWKLWFTVKDDNMEKMEGFLKFSKDYLTQVNLEIIPPQKKYSWEKFLFNYKRNKEIKIYLNADKKDIYNNTNIVLNRLNSAKSVNIVWNINESWNELDYNFEYKKDKFDWSFINNYNNYYKKEIIKTTWKISGTTDYKGNIEKMNLDITGNDIDFTLKVDDKKFDTKLNLKDGKESIFSLKANWKYDKDYFKLNSDFEIAENPYKNFWKNIKKEKVIWKFDIESDLKNWKNNAKILFNIKEWEKELINFKLENTWKIEYKKQKIKTPKDFIKMDDVMGEMYNIWGGVEEIDNVDLDYLDF